MLHTTAIHNFGLKFFVSIIVPPNLSLFHKVCIISTKNPLELDPAKYEKIHA